MINKFHKNHNLNFENSKVKIFFIMLLLMVMVMIAGIVFSSSFILHASTSSKNHCDYRLFVALIKYKVLFYFLIKLKIN